MEGSPQEVILGAMTGHWLARCIHVVAEARIADHLDDGSETVEMLSAKAGVDADALDRILRYLVSSGIFAATPEGYANNEASDLLRSDDAGSMRAYACMIGSSWQWQSFGALSHTLATGETGMDHVFGRDSFAYLADHPDDQAMFDAAMQNRAQRDLAGVVAVGDFSRFPVIADIGGGNGSLLRAVLEVAPESRGILFELAHVAAGAPAHPRITSVSGSFFVDPLPSADLYLLRRVIHDWGDEAALRILAAVRRAATPGAQLMLIEAPLPEGPQPHPGKGLDIVMLAVVGGRERTLADYRSLMEAAGFRFVGVRETRTGTALIEGKAV
ncbi:O-methyltransferase [Kaistia soli DSM 19436]|uniref:O-methyltransferase n=1 Tax=Kaistia soli DSM 19436 TaxID=1122133 RepID=A0A1M4UF54_9HYPH|nr:methyltransferase [Kaistia soli]SHE55258.1 O-methyltransferase [Kaistia soli DSM 19436]